MAGAEKLALELGEPLGTPVEVEWDLADPGEGAGLNWRLSGELDPGRVAELRVLSATFEDGSLLGAASLRPRDAAGHDADELAAILVRPETDPAATEDVRLSVEYDAAGQPRRAGLELYIDPDAPPLRVAADRSEARAAPGSQGAVAMEFRLDGTSGSGSYEVLRP
jgi:hypothetical protein